MYLFFPFTPFFKNQSPFYFLYVCVFFFHNLISYFDFFCFFCSFFSFCFNLFRLVSSVVEVIIIAVRCFAFLAHTCTHSRFVLRSIRFLFSRLLWHCFMRCAALFFCCIHMFNLCILMCFSFAGFYFITFAFCSMCIYMHQQCN